MAILQTLLRPGIPGEPGDPGRPRPRSGNRRLRRLELRGCTAGDNTACHLVRGRSRPTAFRVIDAQSARAFQPALEQEYWLVWELPPDTPRSPQVELQYFSHNWRASSLDGGFFWTDRTPVAVQDVSAAMNGGIL